jgi:hypothetical protein
MCGIVSVVVIMALQGRYLILFSGYVVVKIRERM